MTNQTWRTRSCLVPLPVLAMCVALAGCNRDRGPGVPAMTHVVPGNSPCANCWCAQCGPCSGFHPTVWQSWQEGSMALRGRECENGTAPVQHGLNAENGPALPAPSRPHPEWIPTPEANKSDESTTPGMAAPPRSDSLPAKTAPSGGSQVPGQDKGPPPAGKEAAPAPEKLPAKPMILPVPPPQPTEPTQPVTANSTGPIVIASWVSDSSLRFGEVQAQAESANPPPPSAAFPAAFFTHGGIPQAPAVDSGKPHNENYPSLPSRLQDSPR